MKGVRNPIFADPRRLRRLRRVIIAVCFVLGLAAGWLLGSTVVR